MRSFAQIQHLFNEYLEACTFQQQPTALYEPVNYILSLGGKRLRPVLALLGCQIFDKDIEKALPVAYAVEIFHNFSLVHDDIMDQAPLRRGKPTVHTKYTVNNGILSGDVMLIYAYEFLTKVQEIALIPELVKVFNRFSIEVCEGQQMDMNFEQCSDVSLEEYLKMIELKTAALIGGALQLGAMVGGASAEDALHLAAFGRKMGIAFQLQDDLLDTFGDPQKFGKKVGGDIAQNKKTYLIIKALEIADSSTRQELLHWMSVSPADEQPKIQAVTAIMNRIGIKDKVEAAKQAYQQDAMARLNFIKGDSASKDLLAALANELVNRDF